MIVEGTSDPGDVFMDTREAGDAVPFVVGRGDMIRGLETALPTMRQGEIAVFTILPDYGYDIASCGCRGTFLLQGMAYSCDAASNDESGTV